MSRHHDTTRRRAVRMVATAATAAVMLAGCGSDVPQPEPEPAATAPVPVLDDDRIERILDDVQTVVAEGDEALDAELLESRVSGPALDMRRAEYQLAAASDGERAPTPLTTDSQVEVVAATDEWPRSLFVVSHIPQDANLPLLLVLTQQSPRDQYKLWFWSPLLPGAQTPTTARPEAGSPPLAPDAEGLRRTPAEAVSAYADLLGDPGTSSDFADDPFRAGYREMIDALSATVEVAGEVTERYAVRDGSVAAMTTDDGGALVVGVIDAGLTISRTVDGSTLEAGGDIALLMGDGARIAGSATADYLVPVALVVPPAGSPDPITVLGAGHVISQVSVEEPEPEADDESEDG
ncbi:hypothetical protein [Georgenia sunbinii]|uniref:hypothetical protein n=1 Tax=Georgenia sunbinii TaxID=3117728 RepID=UPI002F269C9A